MTFLTQVPRFDALWFGLKADFRPYNLSLLHTCAHNGSQIDEHTFTFIVILELSLVNTSSSIPMQKPPRVSLLSSDQNPAPPQR